VKTETARLLGIKTSALYYKLEKYGIGALPASLARSPRTGNKEEPRIAESEPVSVPLPARGLHNRLRILTGSISPG